MWEGVGAAENLTGKRRVWRNLLAWTQKVCTRFVTGTYVCGVVAVESYNFAGVVVVYGWGLLFISFFVVLLLMDMHVRQVDDELIIVTIISFIFLGRIVWPSRGVK